jgi:hypothetical protein
MSFMQLTIYKKGKLYSADCAKCGITMHSHEWYHVDNNDRRDAMQAGTLRCDDCGGCADPETFQDCGRQYAGLYSAPVYIDRTGVSYGRNRRKLEKELREMYNGRKYVPVTQ